jgi:hypothetical protein
VDAVHPRPPPQLQPAATAPAPARTEKIDRPKLEMKDGSSTEEQWNFFTFSLQQYKTIANITGNEKERLGVCLGDMVASLVYARLGDQKYKELTEDDLLKEARQLVVKSRNKLVHRPQILFCVCVYTHVSCFSSSFKLLKNTVFLSL